MKKLLVMFSLSFLMASPSFAQEAPKNKKERKPRMEQANKVGEIREGKTPEERAAKRTEMLAKKYNLNQTQQDKVKALHQKQMNEVAAARSKGQMGEKQRAALKERKAEWDSELKSILTKEQYSQYEADRGKRENKLEERKGKKGQRFNGRDQKQKREQRS